jgi:hypothetical protein
MGKAVLQRGEIITTMSDEEKLHHLIDAFLELQDDLKRIREVMPELVKDVSAKAYAAIQEQMKTENAAQRAEWLTTTKELSARAEKILLGIIQTTLARAKEEFAAAAEQTRKLFESLREQVVTFEGKLTIVRNDNAASLAATVKELREFVLANGETQRREFAAGGGAAPNLASAFKGPWSKDAALKTGDLFTYRGATYLALRDASGIVPSKVETKGSRPRYVAISSRGGGGASIDMSNFNGIVTVGQGGTGVQTATGTGSVVRSTSPTLVTPILGVATGTSLVIGAATGGATAGVVNAKGFKIDGVDVGVSTDTYWADDGGTGIKYSAGTLRLAVEAGVLQLGTTNQGSLAVNANGALTITPKAGQPLYLASTAGLALTAAAETTRSLGLFTAGVERWKIVANSVAESGSDAGSNFSINAYTDAGASIDSPISIARVAGGAITLARNVAMSSATATLTLGATNTGTLAVNSDGDLTTTPKSGRKFIVAGGKLNVASLPTSASGLATGDIWANSGVLTVVA